MVRARDEACLSIPVWNQWSIILKKYWAFFVAAPIMTVKQQI